MRRTVLSIAMAMVAALGTVAAHAGDQEIANAVLQQLKDYQDAGQLKGFNIKLSVKEGRVWMKGSVANQDQHEKAIEAARHVEGVTMVVNELTIAGTKHEHPEQQMTLPQRARNFLTGQESAEQQSSNADELQQPASVPNVGEYPLAVEPDGNELVQLASRQQEIYAEPAARLPVQPEVDAPISENLPELPPKREISEAVAASNVPDLTQWQQPKVSEQVAQLPEGVSQTQMAAMPIFVPQQSYQAQPAAQPSSRPAAVAESNLPGSEELRQARQQQAQQQAQQQQAAQMAALQQEYMMRMAMLQRQGGVPAQPASMQQGVPQAQQMAPSPQYIQGTGGGVIPARYDHPQMPGYSWPSYASHPNYAALQYPKQHAAHAWPYIGPFYPYPQVPLGWRKVTLSWDDGWWFLDFKDKGYGPYVTR